jgi:hypothetical protein
MGSFLVCRNSDSFYSKIAIKVGCFGLYTDILACAVGVSADTILALAELTWKQFHNFNSDRVNAEQTFQTRNKFHRCLIQRGNDCIAY